MFSCNCRFNQERMENLRMKVVCLNKGIFVYNNKSRQRNQPSFGALHTFSDDAAKMLARKSNNFIDELSWVLAEIRDMRYLERTKIVTPKAIIISVSKNPKARASILVDAVVNGEPSKHGSAILKLGKKSESSRVMRELVKTMHQAIGSIRNNYDGFLFPRYEEVMARINKK